MTEIFGKYKIETLLGSGQFGIVYMGINLDTNERVVIKVIDKSKLTTISQRNKIIRDVEIPRMLKCHKNIICILDTLETDQNYLIISEFVAQSRPLNTLQLTKMNLDDIDTRIKIVDMMWQLADALEYMHFLGVAHRDLKTQNIILKGGFIPMIIDFDLACIPKSKDEIYHCKGVAGSPLYYSPEKWRMTNVDEFTSDVYALGIIFYFLANKKLMPYDADSIDLLKMQVLSKKPRPSASGIDLLDTLIMSMISKYQEDRPQLMEIKYILAKLLKEL